ncbi:MAG: hypothetical protein ACKVHE_15435, partial [Planctomycetales bacterium]
RSTSPIYRREEAKQRQLLCIGRPIFERAIWDLLEVDSVGSQHRHFAGWPWLLATEAAQPWEVASCRCATRVASNSC